LCRQYASIIQWLHSQPATKEISPLWTGERVGLAYDSAQLFLDAARDSGGTTAADIPSEFTRLGPYNGATGTIDFSQSHISTLPLAIVRIAPSSLTAMPICAYPAEKEGFSYGPGPNGGSCPNDRQ
jgi:hypothetical protein